MNAIDSRTSTQIASIVTVAALSLVSVACSSAMAEPSRGPSVSIGAAPCHATGKAKVVARKVFVPGGVEATALDETFSIRFATAASRCVAVAWPSATEAPQSTSCPTPRTRTASRENAGDETMLAWESHDEAQPHVTLGVVTYDMPQTLLGIAIGGKRKLVERTFFAPGVSRDAGQMAPDLAPIGHDRFLLAWVDGNVESRELRAQSVVGWGDPLGAPMVLSPSDASVIGRPSIVVAPSGYGLATYVASIDGEFAVLATPIACAMN